MKTNNLYFEWKMDIYDWNWMQQRKNNRKYLYFRPLKIVSNDTQIQYFIQLNWHERCQQLIISVMSEDVWNCVQCVWCIASVHIRYLTDRHISNVYFYRFDRCFPRTEIPKYEQKRQENRIIVTKWVCLYRV